MERILITGATGNVGQAILQHFVPGTQQELYIASRKQHALGTGQLYFDFNDLRGSASALQKIDTLFLLRPPHISDVKTFFKPLIELSKEQGLKHIIFLSVQGAEHVSFIPHAKIEKLIVDSGIPYTFIRPSYFMQNLTTTLADDIRDNSCIYLPAGSTPFLWVDVSDIGKAIAAVLKNTQIHQFKAYTITGRDLVNFGEVATMLSTVLQRKIRFMSPNPLKFYLAKKKAGTPSTYILVMIMLHYLPRFQKLPRISDDLALLTGDAPVSLREFIENSAEFWNSALPLSAQKKV